MGEMRNAYTVLVRKPEGKNHPEWWKDIKMGLREIEWEVVDWIHLA
jgi:hypothetical protein